MTDNVCITLFVVCGLRNINFLLKTILNAGGLLFDTRF